MRSIFKRLLLTLRRTSPGAAAFVRRRLLRSVTRRIRGAGNRVDCSSSVLRGVTFDIDGSGNTIEIAEAFLRNVTFRIRGDGHKIVIGRKCSFNRGGSIWFEDHHGRLVIGEGSTFENVHIAVTEPRSSVVIGADCMFANDIDIRTGDSHSVLDAQSGARINPAANIQIGDHVWVAAHCILLKGVRIADHTVVATASVVTKPSPQPGVILAGNPAKVIKENITWSRERL